MVDLRKPPNEEKLKKFSKSWNMPNRISIFPYLVTIWLLPIGVGIILYQYKINFFIIAFFVFIIILIEAYFILKSLKNKDK